MDYGTMEYQRLRNRRFEDVSGSKYIYSNNVDFFVQTIEQQNWKIKL